MSKPITLIIADDEPFICGMLEKLINFDALGLTLLECVNDGQTLETRIKELHPDVVLTDISMPRQDGLDVIRKTREQGITCRFVIISGYQQFEYAYNALKYDVDDYLLKPVEQAELNRVLKKICGEIASSSFNDVSQERTRLHTYLVEWGIHRELRNDGLTLEEINETYQTSFQRGAFRFAMMKLDFTRDEAQRKEDVSSIIAKLRSLALQQLQACCSEIVFAGRRDRVTLLLNYDGAREAALNTKLTELHARTRHIVELFRGINLTLCVGTSVPRICQCEQAYQSCQRALWLRVQYGIDRVIFEDSFEDVPFGGYRRRIDEMRQALERAYLSMDSQALQTQLDAFFALPVPVLCGTEAMEFLYGELAHLSQRCGDVTRDPIRAKGLLTECLGDMEMQTTFRDCRAAASRGAGRFLSLMAEFVRDKNAKPVLRATAYIESHYAERITLETMADLVNLNPIYFSNLFKRELGKSFTEYLTEYRMKKAKELLRMSNQNINEIADTLGYSDARYFSKAFKKEVGIKPTDYRKIYG